MIHLQYKERIRRAKFTSRSIRYVLSDQAARLRLWQVHHLPLAVG
jgi:hypothetical protein